MEKTITPQLLDELLAKAAASPRLRTNFNLHENTDDPVNRLCIAAQTGSVFPIQRHPGKWELVTCLRGKFVSRIYGDKGQVLREYRMGEDVTSLEIPAGTWHSIEVLTPCVFLEVKPGPYAPVAPEDTLNV